MAAGKSENDKLGLSDKDSCRDRNIESLLIVEKALETSGQKWVDNINVIEQYLVKIVELISKHQSDLAANFVVRRLPIYTASWCNKNEYAIVLRNIDFTLQPARRSSAADTVERPPIGQVEIFRPQKRYNFKDPQKRGIDDAPVRSNGAEDIFNEDGAYRSDEIFKKFASSFIRASTLDCTPDTNTSYTHDPSLASHLVQHVKAEKVQLLGPHLLQEMVGNREIDKIFTLANLAFSQAEVQLSRDRRLRYADCKISINYLQSVIVVSLDDTEVQVRPCVFYNKGFSRVNSNILDRLPLFHPSLIGICDGLSKGCLLFPNNSETLWDLQMWPCESHLISIFHSNSIVTRIFKLYSAFCLNPLHFWETLNNCFLIGMNDLQDDLDAQQGKLHKDVFSLEFTLSSYLFEMENFPNIQDWSPSLLYKRFMNLVTSSVEAMDRGFQAEYFTGLNILRGVWKSSPGYFGREERYALQELDGIDEEMDDAATTVTAEQSTDYLDVRDDDEFGLRLENLEISDDPEVFGDRLQPRPSSHLYKSASSFASVDNLPGSSRKFGRRKSSKKYDLEYSDGDVGERTGGGGRKAKTLSKMFGSSLIRKIASLGRSQSDAQDYQPGGEGGRSMGRQKTLADITSDFVDNLSQSRREQCQLDSLSSGGQTETCFTTPRYNERGVDTEFPTLPLHPTGSQNRLRGRSQSAPTGPGFDERSYTRHKAKLAQEEDLGSLATSSIAWRRKRETVYTNILAILEDIPPSDYLCDSEITQDLARGLKNLQTQEELADQWLKTMGEFPTPKTICPHAFNVRQVEYLSRVIKAASRCLPSAMINAASFENPALNSKVTAWEISGDLLRVVLHQLRAEPPIHEALRLKQDKLGGKKLSLKTLKQMITSSGESEAEGRVSRPQAGRTSSCQPFSFKRRHSVVCTGHRTQSGDGGDPGDNGIDPIGEIQFAMEEPEVAATNRLLQWLWQLRTSGIGRLSFKAKRYLEQLHAVSHVNSFFLEQHTEEKILKLMALKSAVAVSRIMKDPNVPAYVPLVAATKKGWQWAEMVLSLASWNREKGFPIQAELVNPNDETQILLRDISLSGSMVSNTLKKLKSAEPDFEALTLAFHSELATPLGWNDFEDPRKPGPFTVPVLILSSMSYFKQWEMIPGNIVQVMVRLQRFNDLEHVATLLLNPHRKTAMTEVRKLNKTLSMRVYQFDDKVMSKTFKRLASLRSTRKKLQHMYFNRSPKSDDQRRLYTCHQLDCQLKRGVDNATFEHRDVQIQCTKF